MDTKKVEKVIQLLKKHDLAEMEIEHDGFRIRVASVVAGATVAAAPTQVVADVAPVQASVAKDVPSPGASAAPDKQIRSPFVGTFYEAPSPGADPFVKPGQKVRKGEVLCIIEAMKIMNEIEAERDCTIKEVLIGNHLPVEFDQVLFVIE